MEDFQQYSRFSTDVIHTGQQAEQWNSLAVVPPITTATTYKLTDPSEVKGFLYSRLDNPTRSCLETCLAAAEGAKHALCFSSGLASIVTATHLLKAGDHLLCIDDVYGGTNKYFNHCATRFGVEVSMVDLTNMDNVKENIKSNTSMVWIETPTNPTLKLVDISAVVDVVRSKCEDAIVVVDNTFMSPCFQRPLTLGADVVMYSVTKYINGHTDVIMGALVCNSDEIFERLKFLQTYLGAIPSPFDCYLANRGLKTLSVRMKEHMKNGLLVAQHLEKHPAVERVLHPGLPSHPQYELGKRQMIGYSGMCVFFIKGGLKEAAAFVNSLKIFTLAVSLGGYESLVELPSKLTHAPLTQTERDHLGITDNMIRVSVGLENAEDLINDLDQALNAVFNKSSQ